MSARTRTIAILFGFLAFLAFGAASAQQQSRNSSGDALASAIFIPFFNGIFLEWGDELSCKVTSDSGWEEKDCRLSAVTKISDAWAQFPTVSTVTLILGILLSPFGLVAIMASRSKQPGEAFRLGAGAEAIEGVVAAAGEYSTFGSIDEPGSFIVFTIVAMLATGTIAATMKAWQTNPAFRALVPIGVVGLVVLAIYHQSQ